MPHVSTKDTIVANYFIPKGSHVILRRQGIGTNPKVWDEPLKFKPERHLKKDGSNLNLLEPNLRLITFSAGRRSCPGVTLGTTMTVMLFARLVHGFTWSAPSTEPFIDLSECPEDTSKAKPLMALAKPRLPPEQTVAPSPNVPATPSSSAAATEGAQSPTTSSRHGDGKKQPEEKEKMPITPSPPEFLVNNGVAPLTEDEYVKAPKPSIESSKMWQSQILLPFKVDDVLYSFLGPIASREQLASVSSFFPSPAEGVSFNFWCPAPNNFHFPCGIMGHTLFDIAHIASLPANGESISWDDKVDLSDYSGVDYSATSYSAFVKNNQGEEGYPITPVEYVVFLTFWLNAFIF
ncbi:hypothetical protein PIB30_081772 [Stylosanthes scabra]|uniref:Cytochrome P450 n=1 Tax=Stylosanthes scabra TaxID=79078 RepID=A0ABU6RRX0_9FABA|nr:hypothetical protein [Stylosanthes scabra]